MFCRIYYYEREDFLCFWLGLEVCYYLRYIIIVIVTQQFVNIINNNSNSNKKMSVNKQNQSLKTDIKDFIQLLQNNQNPPNNRRRLSLDSDKLSIIYSASQPQSSLADKQNSHNSANKTEEIQEIQCIVKEIRRMGINPEQDKLLARLVGIVGEFKKGMGAAEGKYKLMEAQFEEEKAGTDEILRALVKMDEAEKQLYASYNELSERYTGLEKKFAIVKEQNQKLSDQLQQSSKDIQFMRKLVLVANENYENMEKKCKNLQRSCKMVERIKQQRSSPEIVTRSTIVHKKSSCSPSISDRSNLSAQKSCFQENYRKLVLRTLKSKAIR